MPYFPIDRGIAPLQSDILRGFARVLESGTFVGGAEVSAVESAIAEKLGFTWCVGVANGLDALRLSIQAMGVKPGDEVVVPAQTFVATWLSVIQAGANPVACDVDGPSGLLDVAGLDAVLGPRTVGIVPVHLHGQSADMAGVCEFAARNGLWVVDDAAQSHGDEIPRHLYQSTLRATAYSFYPSKNLGGLGDGGAVATMHDEVAEAVRRLGNYGRSNNESSEVSCIGWNSRLDPLQASAIGIFLTHLDAWNRARQRSASLYSELLGPLVDEGLVLLHRPIDSVWHHFPVQIRNRDDIQSRLARVGVETKVHYRQPPVQIKSIFDETELAHKLFPGAVSHARRTLSLPMHPWLAEDEVAQVISALTSVMT